MSKKINAQLQEISLAIEGVMENPSIMNKIGKHGYTQKVMLEGQSLVKEVKRLRTLQTDGIGIQKTATKRFHAARREVHTVYMRHLQIVRLDLDPVSEHWDTLKIEGIRKLTLSGWLEQVTAFYDNISRVQDILDRHNITAEEIAQVQAMVAAIVSFKVRQAKGKSERQQASVQSKKALKDLQNWWQDFLYIARHALKDNSQQLEALGIVV